MEHPGLQSQIRTYPFTRYNLRSKPQQNTIEDDQNNVASYLRENNVVKRCGSVVNHRYLPLLSRGVTLVRTTGESIYKKEKKHVSLNT